MALTVAWIVAIAIGSGLLFFIAGYVAVTSVIFRRNKRKVADLERRIIATEIGAPPECANISRPPMALRKSIQSPTNTAAGWGVLPSNEDLHEEYQKKAKRRTDKRKSDMLSWPLPRRKSTKRATIKKAKGPRLSTVVESPSIDSRQSIFDALAASAPVMDTSGDIALMEKADTKTPESALVTRNRSPSGSPAPEISPSEARRPAPLRFSKRSSQLITPTEYKPELGRAVTVPTILVGSDETAPADAQQNLHKHKRNSRSISLGCPSDAPTGPPPPLPTNLQQPRPGITRMASSESVTSQESVGSSVLKTSLSPNIRARNEFSDRHPEMGLVPKVRQNDPQMKDTLIAGPRQAQVSSSIRNSPRLASSTASLLLEPSKLDDQRSLSPKKSFMDKLRQVSQSELNISARDARSAVDGPLKKDDNIIRVLSKPANVDTAIRRVSDQYDPKDREGSKGPVDLINTNIPSADDSQTSLHSADSIVSNGNPFHWDSQSPIDAAKRSALKGSPNARKSHRRQNCVRISINPTVLGPPSRTNSSSRMFEIAEEDPDKPSSPLNSSPTPVRPPSRSTFEPKLNSSRMYRSSLKGRSPVPSVTEHEDGDLSIPRSYRRNTSTSPDRRQSTASSNLSIPLFPVHDFPPESSDRDDGFEETKTYGAAPTPNQRRQQTIPGFTLLNKQKAREPELQYPTIDLADSPASSNTEHLNQQIPRSPTQQLNEMLESHSTIPRGLSPPPKSSATTQVSQEACTMPAARAIGVTNANPLDNRPDFSPRTEAVLPGGQLVGPRAPPAPSIMKIAKGLRRDNSDAFRMSDSKETRRYLSIGRSGSPNLSIASMTSSPILGSFPYSDDEKENTPPTHRRKDSTGWSDSFWDEASEKRKQKRRGGIATFETPSPQDKRLSKSKSVTWGGVDFSNTPSAHSMVTMTPASLYDDNGFYVGDMDDSPS